MDDVPWGYLAGVLVALAAVVVAVRPPPTNGPHPTLAFVFGTASSEVPMVFLLLLIGSTVLAVTSGDLDTPAGWVAAGLAAAGAAGLISVQVEAFAARRAVVNAVDAAVAGGGRPAPSLRPAERWRTALAPLRWPSLDIQVVRNLTYGPHGRANTLDVVRRSGGVHGAAVLVHLHGGGYFTGRKSHEARLLMQALAHRGWLCVSANYRLAPGARFPEILVDAKRVIAWVRTEGPAYGAGHNVVACGGSAGANLAMNAALTAQRSDLQPGFEDVDTAVQAVVALYGYYGPAPTNKMPSAPGDHVTPDAPPVLVVHGALDPMVPAANARTFVQRLRETSRSPSRTPRYQACCTPSTVSTRCAMVASLSGSCTSSTGSGSHLGTMRRDARRPATYPVSCQLTSLRHPVWTSKTKPRTSSRCSRNGLFRTR